MDNLPKTVKVPNDILTATLDVNVPLVKGVVPIGAEIIKVRIIAGYGTSTELRASEELVYNYGGEKDKWEKKGGIISTENFDYDVHWYEYERRKYLEKLKGVNLK